MASKPLRHLKFLRAVMEGRCPECTDPKSDDRTIKAAGKGRYACTSCKAEYDYSSYPEAELRRLATFSGYKKVSEKEKGKGDRTIETYLYHLDKFFAYCRHKQISEVDHEDIIRYKGNCFDRGDSSSTVAVKLSALASYVRFIRQHYRDVSLRIMADDILDLRPKVTQKVPDALEPWQIAAVVELCETIEEEMIVRLLFMSGLRAEEFLGLSPTCTGDTWINVVGKGDKERQVPLNEETMQALKGYIEHLKVKYRNKPIERIFDISYSTLWSRISDIRKRAIKANIIKDDDKFSAHVFRHSYATDLLDKDTDISVINYLLGHASMNTTKRYTKVKPKAAMAAVNKLTLKGLKRPEEVQNE